MPFQILRDLHKSVIKSKILFFLEMIDYENSKDQLLPWSKQDNKQNFCCNFAQLLLHFILVKIHIISDENVNVTCLIK